MRRWFLLLTAAAAAATAARAQQFDGPRLRYPEHASEQTAAAWATGVVKEQVEANATIKEGLARHQLFLIPNPPHPPAYAAKGTQYGDVSREKDFGYQGGAGGEEIGWCSQPGQRVKWTSERGSVMLDGRPMFLKGINWYGMETELFVPQGLWHYKPEEFMQFLATHRFNAIRLPFSYEWAARGLDTPLLNPYVVQDDMRGYTQGQFLDRIFDSAAKFGVVVLLDLHVLSVEKGIQDLWYDHAVANEEQILEAWEAMLKHVAWRWNLVGIDIKNEPHGIATWGKGNKATDWNIFAQRAIRHLAERVPEFEGLFFVEGVEGHQWETKYAYWWGGNFDGVKHAPIRTGREDLDKRVVYSPHIYGPEVFSHHGYFHDASYPENMFDEVWDYQFSWIEKTTGRAVVLGEWGGSIVGDPKAAANQQTLARWLVKACIPDNFWWCLNPHTKFNGGMLGESYEVVDENVLRILHFVNPKPTRFVPNEGEKTLCVVDGAFANARCSLKMGQSLAQAKQAVKAEVDIEMLK